MKYTSAVLAGASGSLGGAVYSHNRFGQYIRTRAIPTNPQTPFQSQVRSTFGDLATAWNTLLSPAQRAAWGLYAAQVPVINSLGASVYLTGLNWYVAINSLQVRATEASIDLAPSVYNRTGLPFPPAAITITAATDLVNVSYDNAAEWAIDTLGLLHVFVSRPTSPTINFFRGPYRFAGVINGDTAVPPTSPTTVPAPFGFIAGQLGHVKLVAQAADGRTSPPLYLPAVAV